MSRKLVRRYRSVPFSFVGRFQCGFTLAEVVITLAVVSILSTVGVGSYQGFLIDSEVSAMSMRLRTDLMLARSEALKRGRRITLCRLAEHSDDSCAGHASTGRPSWNNGWLMFADLDTDRVFDLSKGDQLLGVYRLSGTRVQLKWNRGDYVSYKYSGELGSGSGSFCVGASTGSPELQRRLVILWTGRLRTAEEACHYEFP